MASLAPTHSIKRDDLRSELYFSVGGYWKTEMMTEFLDTLGRKAYPFIQHRTKYVAIGNFEDFVPQNRDAAQAIRDSLMIATKHGLVRFAVVAASPLVMLQYKRITKDLEVEFFENETDARAWLHAG